MRTLKKFRAFKLDKSFLKKVNAGLKNCQHYENSCMQTAQRDDNLFLMDDCDNLCDSNGDWN